MSDTCYCLGRKTNINRSTFYRILLGNKNLDLRAQKIYLANKGKVNLNAWIDPERTEQNIGDYLSFVVVKKMCEMLGISFNGDIKHTKHLYAIGSILLGYQDCTVWGSGFLNDGLAGSRLTTQKWIHKLWHKTDVRAVRGPKTRQVLLSLGISCPEVYGDPAILLPLFYTPRRQNKKPYIIIPHYVRVKKYLGREDVLNPSTNNWKSFIDQLIESELVISASLHGVILAEAYGVPAVLLDDIPGLDLFKYEDWYYSTGRKSFPLVKTVDEALQNREANIPLQYSIIEKMQKGLIASFPKDLWE